MGGFPYGDDCVFVANDWHTALVPILLAGKYRPYGVYLAARSVLCIHNLFHQGCFPPTTFNELGLDPHCERPHPLNSRLLHLRRLFHLPPPVFETREIADYQEFL